MITANETVKSMIKGLKDAAKNSGVDLIGLTYKNFNTFLDDAFADGGESRCINFCDIAFEYALQFGDFESDCFEDARWRVTKRALMHFERKTISHKTLRTN